MYVNGIVCVHTSANVTTSKSRRSSPARGVRANVFAIANVCKAKTEIAHLIYVT